MGKKTYYEVGYGRPPKHSQFTKDNQPTRLPRKLPPRPNITMIELDKELVTIRQPDGSQLTMTAEEAGREKLIDKALHGDMKSMRLVYGHLDREFESWAEKPTYEVLEDHVRIGAQAYANKQEEYRAELYQFIALGLVEHIFELDFRIAPSVMQAYNRHQAASLASQRSHWLNPRSARTGA